MTQEAIIRELAANPQLVTAFFESVYSQMTCCDHRTVEDWAAEWLEVYVDHRPITEKSIIMYHEKLKRYILPVIGSKYLDEVTEIDLQKLVNSASSSRSTAQKVRIVLGALFGRAHKIGLIAKNPALDLELPKASSGRRRSITDEERTAILRLCESHPAGLYIKTLLYTGIRPGEAIALTWADVDFSAHLLHIRHAVESGTNNNIKEPKTAAGRRSVPLPDVLLNEFAHKRGEPGDYIFVKPMTGERHTHSSINDYWHNFRRALDISLGAELYRNKIVKSVLADDLVPYCLRHTYCTDLQRAGVPLNVARYLMGHSDVSVTSGIYTDTTPDVLAAAGEKLDRLYSNL